MSSDLALEQMLPKCVSLRDVSATVGFCRLLAQLTVVSRRVYLAKPDMLSGHAGCAPTWPLEATHEGCEQASESCSLPVLTAQLVPTQTALLA